MRVRTRIGIVAVLVAVALTATIAWADSDDMDSKDMHSATVEDVLAEIRNDLGLGAEDKIDPMKVPSEFLETLGDAVMGLMAGGDEQHEWMDRMMGGEGSESLTSAHQWMGYRYLSGGYTTGSGFDSMMGSGMMGGMMMGGTGNAGGFFGAVPYDSPEEIAKKRYAAGEISRQQYLQIIEDLDQ